MKLLIVDDEPHIRQMMRMTLEAAGHDVVEAATGDEALSLFRDGREHDVVVLDQRMPGMDGLETLRRMKQRSSRTPVLMVTAYGSIELAVDAMKLGATDFLRKPMTPEALRSAVTAAAANIRTAATAPSTGTPGLEIQILTLNGFQIIPVAHSSRQSGTHSFRVKRHEDASEVAVTVTIDPEAVARVERLTRRRLEAGGAFWRIQAERVLSGYLWSEGKIPPGGTLTVHDISREDLDVAVDWTAD
jgi:DNA-binding response OmpR family regulator